MKQGNATMKTKAVYEVESDGSVQVFCESAAGGLDFEGVPGTSEAEKLAAERLAGGCPRAELIYPNDDFGSPIYRRAAGRPSRVFRRARPKSEAVSVETAGFLWRLPSFLAYLEAGNYMAAGLLVERSRKVAPYKPLLRYLTGGTRAFLVFALCWLGELDAAKEPALASLLSGSSHSGSCYGACLDFAREYIMARTIGEFEAECRRQILELFLARIELLVLAVAGTRYRSCVADLSYRIVSAREEAFRRAILDGRSEQKAVRRIRAYLESIEALLVPEPYNPCYRNAVCMLMRFPDERIEQAGYLKREIAAMLAPMIAEGVALSGKIDALNDGEVDVQVRAG
jgi:hypothetical protein